jgi:tripartite-type tricarboxylate transporter receptor subunit TctC
MATGAAMQRPWIAGVVAGLIAWAGAASAQNWPTQPVTLVVPFAAGGPTDVVGRVIAARLSEILGQQIVVENVTGAGGMTGALRVAQAPPDGSQVLLGTVGTQAYSQTLYKRPLYNAIQDFAPVALIAEQSLMLVARTDLAANTLAEFIAYARSHESDMSFGSGGAGSSTHLGCVLLNSAIGVRIQHIPYRGSAPAMQDLAAGRIDYLCDAVTTALPQVQARTVKGLAVFARKRFSILPDVPTADEQGLANFEASNWIGLFFPRGAPAAIIRRLNEATLDAMATPSVQERMQTLGTDLVSVQRAAPDYLQRFVASEIDKWAEPIKASGVSVD